MSDVPIGDDARVEVLAASASASPRDLAAAVEVWRAANTARGLRPTAERIARVQQKVQVDDALVVVARADRHVVAMSLAEPGRGDDGRGEVVPGYGHISMVFVSPLLWGRGIGTALMSGLHRHARDRGWTTLTLWTRENNTRAQRLYAASGYRRCNRNSTLQSGEKIIQLEHPMTAPQTDLAPALGARVPDYRPE